MPSKKKKGKGGRKGKGCGGGGKGRKSAAAAKQPPVPTSVPTADRQGRADVADADDSWQPGGRKMSRRIETDKRLYLSSVTRLIPRMGCQSQLPRFPREEDFVDLSNRAKLAIYSPDGSAVSKEEMISNPVHFRVMYYASVLAEENCERVGRTYQELFDSSEESDRSGAGGTGTGSSDAARARIAKGRALLEELSNKAKALSEEYASSDVNFVPVLWHFDTTGILSVFGEDYKDYDDIDDLEATIENATESMASCLLCYGLHEKNYFLASCCDCLFRRAIALDQLGKPNEVLLDLRGACAAARLHVCGQPIPEVVSFGIQSWYLATLARQKISRAHAQRPLFSDRERKKIEKELGIGMYGKARYVCRGCGAEPSDNVLLRRCGGCRSAWFCSKACLKQSWHSGSGGHKGECRPNYEEEIFSKELQPLTDDDFLESGDAVRNIKDYGPVVILHDMEKDEYFSALSDHTVYFAK